MNKEEKEKVEKIKWNNEHEYCNKDDVDFLLNLIQKQEKEIKNLKEDISNMYDEEIVRNILEYECGLSKYEIDGILN